MIRRVEEYCKRNKIIEKGDKIVIGLSGGADSVCLFFVLSALKEKYDLTLQAVHIHHGIRRLEADRDAAFVEGLCRQHGIFCQTEYYNVPYIAKHQGISLEEAGRQIRYQTMERIRKEQNFTKIAVAHHSGDQAETILFHLCRGSGLAGLCGMQSVTGVIIRPLLFIDRSEIERFLKERNQIWCMDTTNLENNYSRNLLRNQVLPLLTEQINSNTEGHIVAAGEMLRELYDYVRGEAQRWKRELAVEKADGEVELEAEKLLLLVPFLRREIYRLLLEEQGGLRDISAVHFEQIDRLLFGTVGRSVNLPLKKSVMRTYHSLLFFRGERNKKKETDRPNIVLIPGKEYLLSSGMLLSIGMPEEINQFCLKNKRKREEIMEENPYTKCFDYDTIKDTLKLRTREVGDYLELGVGYGTKTLKRYFIEKKIPKEERGQILLIAEGSHVLWVIGYRISAGYKVTEATKTILQIKISGGQ